jgi:hypothetical protein
MIGPMKWFALATLAVAIAGCGDDAVPGCDPDVPCGAGTGADSGTSTNSGTGMVTGTRGSDDTAGVTSGVTSTSAADDSSSEGTAAATSEDGDTSEGSGTSEAGSDTASSSEGTESTGAQGNVVYTAEAVIGALDRIRVFKEDLDEDRCTWLTLVAPAIAGQYEVTTPEGWAVESIQASDVGDACGSRSPAMFGAEVATSAEGTVELGAVGPSGVYPCDVTVDVTANFAGILPGVPPVDVLDASAIPVDGC